MKFDNTYDKLPSSFFSESTPEPFSEPRLIGFNKQLADDLGIDLEQYSDEELAQIFSGQKIIEGSHLISTVYAAHQFGNFVPRLGDGRAMLLGEVLSPVGTRKDVQLKGSGPTTYSRNGDGLSALGPVIREYIVSEAMYHLGVPTTRALAAVTTGDMVYRQGPIPGGVFTRVAASHIRIGTFQYFANRGDLEGLIALLDYSIERHYPEIQDAVKDGANPALEFLLKVMDAQVNLVADWMSLGFIHGVMNTDNTTVSGETIDFGPCAFMDAYKADKVFSSIDMYGRYAYNNQDSIAAWNLCRLADCLAPLVDKDREQAVETLNSKLSPVFEQFKEKWLQKMRPKLGLLPTEEFISQDRKLIVQLLEYLEENKLDFTLAFRNLADLVEDGSQHDFFPASTELDTFLKTWRQRLRSQDQNTAQTKEGMNLTNPLYIPRNHQVERAIQAAIEGDYQIFNEMNTLLQKPYTYQEKLHHYATPPEPEEEVKATFCGT